MPTNREIIAEEERERKKRKKKKKNKKFAKERDRNFVKLLQDQQILHLAECDNKVALQLIKEYKKEKLNYRLIDDIEAIWENQSLNKDIRYRIVIICIFNPAFFKAQRHELLQGNIPDSSVGLNETARSIIHELIITAFELPYRIWPYWQKINDMTLPSFFDYWDQKFAEGCDEHFFRGAGSITNKPLQNHILKTAEELGAKPLPKKKKYWVELKHEISYPDDKGQKEPAKNAPYIITFPDGKTEKGKLDNKGKARHDNLKIPGRCTVKYEPDLNNEIKVLQDDIKKELDKLVEAERKETRKIQKEYDESNWAEKRLKDAKAAGTGLWNLVSGLFGTLWGIYQSIGNVLYGVSSKANMYVLAPYHAPEIFKQDVKALKEKYEVFRQFTDEDLETYFLFMKDEKTSGIFLQFGEDYLEAQHYSEYIEGGAEAVFGVILTVITAGAGGAATAGAAGARIASTAKNLTSMIKDLASRLKRKRVRNDTSGDTNTRLESGNKVKGGRAKKVKLKPGTSEHKADRWEKYKKRNGKYSYDRWSKQYDTNMKNYKYGLDREVKYRKSMGASEGTLKTPLTNRQIDILKKDEMYAGQLKTGPVSLSKENVLAIQKDAELVKRGWNVEHILEKGASKPYINALKEGGITHHIGSIIRK